MEALTRENYAYFTDFDSKNNEHFALQQRDGSPSYCWEGTFRRIVSSLVEAVPFPAATVLKGLSRSSQYAEGHEEKPADGDRTLLNESPTL